MKEKNSNCLLGKLALAVALSVLASSLCQTAFAHGNKPVFTPEYIAENRGSRKFVIPETYELANIIISLTPYGINDKRRIYQNSDYYKRVKEHFAPFVDHPIVTRLNLQSDADLFDYLNFRENAAYWRFSEDRIVRDGPYRIHWESMTKNLFAENVDLIEDFARKSGFREFFKTNERYYHQAVADFSQKAPLASMIQWLETNFGDGLRYDSYKVVFSPLVSATHSAARGSDGDFRESLMFVGAPHIFGATELGKAKVARMIFTEVDHNFVNLISDKYRSAIDKAMSCSRFWNQSGNYASPYEAFNEYMTWAVFTLWARDQFPAEQFEDIASINRYDMIARGFTQFVYFDAELVRLYRLRKPGQPLGDLFPEIIEFSSKLQKKAVSDGAAFNCSG